MALRQQNDDVTVHPQPACIRTRLESGIHVLTYTESSRKAVDQLAQHILDIHTEGQANIASGAHHVRVLVDNGRVGSQPIRYTMSKMRGVMASLEGEYSSRVAVLFGESALMNVVRTLSNSVMGGRNEFRLFGLQEYDAAVEWLLR